ncbi:hypothetical protein E4T56_gene15084, partial [Termitomyces sp. T112]
MGVEIRDPAHTFDSIRKGQLIAFGRLYFTSSVKIAGGNTEMMKTVAAHLNGFAINRRMIVERLDQLNLHMPRKAKSNVICPQRAPATILRVFSGQSAKDVPRPYPQIRCGIRHRLIKVRDRIGHLDNAINKFLGRDWIKGHRDIDAGRAIPCQGFGKCFGKAGLAVDIIAFGAKGRSHSVIGAVFKAGARHPIGANGKFLKVQRCSPALVVHNNDDKRDPLAHQRVKFTDAVTHRAIASDKDCAPARFEVGYLRTKRGAKTHAHRAEIAVAK